MKKLFLLWLLYSSYSHATCMSTKGKITNCGDNITRFIPHSIENTEAMLSKMRNDMRRKLEGSILPRLGDSMSWGNGTITRTKKGEFRYVTTIPTYYATTLTVATDLEKLAHECSSANDQFMSDYGVDFLHAHDVAAQKEVKADDQNQNQEDYICKAKDSSMMMLVAAAQQYNNKTMTKEQFIEVALAVTKMGNYNNKVSEIGTMETELIATTDSSSKSGH